MTTPLLELVGVSKRFARSEDLAARMARKLRNGPPPAVVHALDKVNISIAQGEVVGLVGESGCGKSTLGRVAVGLHTPSDGERRWQGRTVLPDDLQARLAIQMIFQDPYASLNPRMRVLDIIGEAPVAHGLTEPNRQEEMVAALMQQVGLDASLLRRFPHQFSGGQRARIGIARALAVKPKFLVCDEAVAALDVSIQAQVLNLFIRLREELGLTYLFISHDLGVVQHISDRVVIMYLGRVVESAPTTELFAQPLHPYTQGLLAEVPRLDQRKKQFVAIQGEIPSPINPPSGCHFHPRCPHASERCRNEVPPLVQVAPGRVVACHLHPATSAASTSQIAS
jgi:peptide/nickel transport system ATP-binding protein